MLNFANLNDVEFEYLCKDVLSRMLGVRLERFGTGRDGGVDLTDNAYKPDIIVQVKHYAKTGFTGLLASLSKEVPKVKKHNPRQYYVCCSKELSPQNKADICRLFADYMDSTANIITLVELSDFLDLPENTDILRRHFKLWLESANILTDLLSGDIFIDSDVLLSSIQEDVRLFVQTTAFDRAVSCLENNQVLIIIGNPGVGKSVTSKMLVLRYAAMGYRVRYTTDGSDLAGLKRALSQSAETKEIILLDDCFGQAYFTMKETQENELLALIRHVQRNPNKLLVMNSRVTIYREATERTENLVRSLERKEYRAFVLDMDMLSLREKEKIFYNHLYFSGLPQPYWENVREGKAYREIVKHPNYNPRIIEFACHPRQAETVEATQYSDFILRCLENPEQIWKNEYERRLANTDRILLTTLYSLTNTVIPLQIVQACYEHRLSLIPGIDTSVRYFHQAVQRLSGSMVKVLDTHGEAMLSAANPSVNDFIRSHLEGNALERQAILCACLSVRQLRRLLDAESCEAQLRHIFEDRSVLRFLFEGEHQRAAFITWYCAEHHLLDEAYQPYFRTYLLNMRDVDIYEKQTVPLSCVLEKVFEAEFCAFYGLDRMIRDLPTLVRMAERLELGDLVVLLKHIDFLFAGVLRKPYLCAVDGILDRVVDDYCTDVPASMYDVDVEAAIDASTDMDEQGRGHIDGDAAATDITEMVQEQVLEEVSILLSDLPPDLQRSERFLECQYVDVSGSRSLVEAHLRDDYDFDDYFEAPISGDAAIDSIFER